MRKILAMLLVASMLLCMVPAFSLVAMAEGEEETEYGLNAALYQLTGWKELRGFDQIVGYDTYRDAYCGFDNTVNFAKALPEMLAISKEETDRKDSGLTSLTGWHDADQYLLKWEGTITAENDGSYTLVGRKIDNGFLAYVDEDGSGTFDEDEVFFDYASANHWFDADDARLVSQNGAFKLNAGVKTAVQFWYYEADGGQNCTINVSTDNGATDVSFADAGLSLLLDKTVYVKDDDLNHNKVNALLPAGITANGTVATNDNGCPADNAGNHNFDATIDAIFENMTLVNEGVVSNYETNSFAQIATEGFVYDDFLIKYSGYVTPTVSGTYQFGTSKVDNCLMVEIEVDGESVTAYEFWAKYIWNDNSTTYSDTKVTLEAGKSYPITVHFLEINGGEAVESSIKINDADAVSLANSGLVFTTTEPTAPVVPSTQEILATGSEWKYMTSGEANDQSAPENWNTAASVSENWATGTAPLADEWGTNGDSSAHSTIWATKTFTVEDINVIADWAVMTSMRYDDNIHVYINGNLVYVDGKWNDSYVTYKLANEAKSYLVTGENLIAVTLTQGSGGFDFDMSLYATRDDTSSYIAPIYNIHTADDLLAFVADMNKIAETDFGNTRAYSAYIHADLDMTGKAWEPLTTFVGKVYGQNHTISNITYTSTTTDYAGLLANALANNDANGEIRDLVLDKCTLTAVAGKAALVAGKVDRGIVRNVTVKNSTVVTTGAEAAGIAGEVMWAAEGNDVIVENCTVDKCTISAADNVAGIFCWGHDAVVRVNKAVVTNNTFIASNNKQLVYLASNGGTTITEVHSTLAPSAETPYSFYAQTRTNAKDNTTTDYRIICVADLEWLQAAEKVEITISFNNGTETRSITVTPSEVYKEVKATGDGYTDYYTTAEGAVIFGWVVTGVEAGYTPSVAIETDILVGNEGDLPTIDYGTVQ